jgi:hypothetical protein
MMSPLPLVFSILKIPKIRRAALIGGVALLVVATAWGCYAVIASKFAKQASNAWLEVDIFYHSGRCCHY